jgi:Leucine-rich repeat (LRR) protein
MFCRRFALEIAMKYLNFLVVLLALSCSATANESQVMVSLGPNLDVIGLEYHGTINEDLMKRLTRQTQLRELDLSGSVLASVELLEELKKLKKLEVLCLSEIMIDKTIRITDAEIQHLLPLTELRALYLDKSEITDTGLQQLNELENLQTLYLFDANVATGSLAGLKGLTNLDLLAVTLQETEGQETKSQEIQGLANLRKLYLTGSKIGVADLTFISRLTRLEVLGLSDTDITAEPNRNDQKEYFRPLTQLQNLRYLLVDRTKLNGEPLTVETLRYLRGDSPLQVMLKFDPVPVFGLAP